MFAVVQRGPPYDLLLVNGPAWKALIEEEFGDGIMSAIDFGQVPAVQVLRRDGERAGV